MKTATNNKHRRSASDIVLTIIRQSDIILEILDARFINETRNLKLEGEIKDKGKKIIYVLNKIDLVDINDIYKKIELENLKPYILFSSLKRKCLKNLRNKIKIEAKKILKEKAKQKAVSRFDYIVYVGVIGYPNTGKSSVINLLIGRQVARVSPMAGFTKGEQNLKLTEDIMLIDTPGIIPIGEDSTISKKDLIKHSEIGVRTWDKVKDADMIIANLMKKYPGVLEKHYNMQAQGDSEILIEQLGRKKRLLKKGNLVNTDRTSRIILRDWQEGKIKI